MQSFRASTINRFTLFLVASAFIGCAIEQPEEEEDAHAYFQCEEPNCRCEEDAECQITDLFALDSISTYRAFSFSDAVNTQDGFGVYHDEDASVGSIVHFGLYELDDPIRADGSGGAGGAGSETFEDTLSVLYDASRWMSIRRQFSEQADLCGCTGVEFDLYTVESTSRTLRFTLSDLECTDALDEPGEDELWWSDTSNAFDDQVGWTTNRLPFDAFDESHGAGTRHNDNVLSLKCIQAIEFSILSGEGHFLIRNVRTYAD